MSEMVGDVRFNEGPTELSFFMLPKEDENLTTQLVEEGKSIGEVLQERTLRWLAEGATLRGEARIEYFQAIHRRVRHDRLDLRRRSYIAGPEEEYALVYKAPPIESWVHKGLGIIAMHGDNEPEEIAESTIRRYAEKVDEEAA